MTLSEKIWGNTIGAFVQYGYTAAKAALLPLKVTDNGDNTGTLNVSGTIALPTGAATSAKQDTGNTSLESIANISDLVDLGGAQRLPGNGASQALTVPANTLIMRVDAEGGAVRISHTGAASATTIPRVPEEAIDYIPLGATDAPQFYGASASVIANINYYGART